VSASAAPASPFRGYRFPPEIISHAVWLYYRFSLSHRDVEELLAEPGIQVSYQAIRPWCRKFGPLLASELRRSHPRRGDKWFLDEVALTMNKRRYWLWRAVDQHGAVLDILVQSRRDQHAAERFLHRVLDAEDGVEPRVIVTDKLASYVTAISRVLPNADHRRHKRLNNRAENSHRPVRKRESGRCSGSSRRSRRSNSWRRSAPYATTSVRGGTVSQPGATARSCARDLSSGTRSPI
jgi:putative transposase